MTGPPVGHRPRHAASFILRQRSTYETTTNAQGHPGAPDTGLHVQ